MLYLETVKSFCNNIVLGNFESNVNLKEADGFVYRNYILVLHLHSFLHSFHLEAQTVYMVSFPGVKLKLGGGHFDF